MRNKKIFSVLSIFLGIVVEFSLFGSAVPLKAVGLENNTQMPIYKSGDEIIFERSETAKKHYLGGSTYSWDVSTEAVHYKDNYADDSEPWKDIDLSFNEQNRITKSPYELTVDPDSYNQRQKN